jgi:hypothetical protein
MHRNYKELPASKRLPYLIVRPEIRTERPEVSPHAASCVCRACKGYKKLFAKLERLLRKEG